MFTGQLRYGHLWLQSFSFNMADVCLPSPDLTIRDPRPLPCSFLSRSMPRRPFLRLFGSARPWEPLSSVDLFITFFQSIRVPGFIDRPRFIFENYSCIFSAKFSPSMGLRFWGFFRKILKKKTIRNFPLKNL